MLQRGKGAYFLEEMLFATGYGCSSSTGILCRHYIFRIGYSRLPLQGHWLFLRRESSGWRRLSGSIFGDSIDVQLTASGY